MIKLSKLTDYAVILLGSVSEEQDRCHSAHCLSEKTGIPEPTTAKILKMLLAGGLLESVRGANGGYRAIGDYSDLPITSVIEVMEGKIALTDCALSDDHDCSIKDSCPLNGRWRDVNAAIYETLQSITLDSVIRKGGKS